MTSVPNGGVGATSSRTASTAVTGVSGWSETATTRTVDGVVVITGDPRPRRPVAVGRRLVDATRELSPRSPAVWREALAESTVAYVALGGLPTGAADGVPALCHARTAISVSAAATPQTTTRPARRPPARRAGRTGGREGRACWTTSPRRAVSTRSCFATARQRAHSRTWPASAESPRPSSSSSSASSIRSSIVRQVMVDSPPAERDAAPTVAPEPCAVLATAALEPSTRLCPVVRRPPRR